MIDLINVGSTLNFSNSTLNIGVTKIMRVFNEQKNSIIATYARFLRLRNFLLTVIAPVRQVCEQRKQRPVVDFTRNNNTKLRRCDEQAKNENNLPEAISVGLGPTGRRLFRTLRILAQPAKRNVKNTRSDSVQLV